MHVSPLDLAALDRHMPIESEQAYDQRDTILYGLGVGVGLTGDPADLPYVYEVDTKVLPSMAVVLSYPGFWQQRPEFGIDWRQVLHAEQRVQIHRPLAARGVVRGRTVVDRLFDKGRDKGALLYVRREIVDAEDGELIATVHQGSFLRGNGGFSSQIDASPRRHSMPDRAPDHSVIRPTASNQAMLYRLSGDWNPLHVDPEVARAAGLERPILHGLATLGLATRALVGVLTDDQPERVRALGARFTAMVFPGDIIETQIWRMDETNARFRCRVPDRDATVIDGGRLSWV